MYKRLRLFLFFVSFVTVASLPAQIQNPFQTKTLRITSDTMLIDSLSLLPGSVQLRCFPADSSVAPRVDYARHSLIFKGRRPDSVSLSYKRLPFNLEKKHYHKDASALYRDLSRPNNPFSISYGNRSGRDNLFINDGLNKNGNISRGISFGNNQDVVVNSNLNLQVSGKLTPEIDMVMAATDNNIPFQADGTTAQLQEFDKVYVQLNNSNTKLVVGDYQLSRPQNSYFMSFYKRAQGIYLENSYRDSSAKKPLIFKTQVSGAVSRGKFCRQVFFGTESNQGPYRLRGAGNEPFIIILSGTERIYIDGKLLQRGQENDYIIDYNTAEITFTARQIITKDKRIVAEFQYAERNYARSLFFFGEEIQAGRGKVFFNVFSEQDNKNKPLLQTLSQDQKNILFSVGDSVNDAVYPGATAGAFNSNDVFYRKTDTVTADATYPGVFVYSTDSGVAKYHVVFSDVGAGRGHYQRISSAANGKVYQWLAPVGGVLQGNYEPVVQLVAPKKNQMLTGGFSYSFTPDNTFTAEGVYTKNDINTFSNKNKGNDEGAGLKLSSRNVTHARQGPAKEDVTLLYNFNYEFVQQRFVQIERFRPIEFDRDWNRPLTGLLRNDQNLASAELGVTKGSRSVVYTFNTFNEGNSYNGARHNVNAGYGNTRGFKFTYNGSLLNTADNYIGQSTRFYRHKSLVSQKVRRLLFSYSDDFENNRFRYILSDSLAPRSYQFWEWEGSVATADSAKNNVKLFYRERRDKHAYDNVLKDSTFATNIGIKSSIYAIKNNPITLVITYRKLNLTRNVRDTLLKPDNTLLNRIEYNPRYFKGLITAGFFYETGYGLENKKEFYYLEVAPGLGQFAWKDYNSNGIKELNEFEVALYSDQARYIRVYTPTNQYVKVLQNQLSISFSIRPSAIIKSPKTKAARFANRWSLQTALRFDNKVSDYGRNDIYNPFTAFPADYLLTSNNNVRQSVFFNQGSPLFGADYTYINTRSRQLLTNGIEARALESSEVKWRVTFLKNWAINSDNIYSLKGNSSQFFTTRNYNIRALESEQKLVYQPGTVFRISAAYKYSQKLNLVESGGQRAYLSTGSFEMKYNQTEKGSFTTRVDVINIVFNADVNSPVAYDMLNGLNAGRNYTWELSYQRNLNRNIQISINYNGRKTPNAATVHLGGAQVRAYF